MYSFIVNTVSKTQNQNRLPQLNDAREKSRFDNCRNSSRSSGNRESDSPMICRKFQHVCFKEAIIPRF